MDAAVASDPLSSYYNHQHQQNLFLNPHPHNNYVVQQQHSQNNQDISAWVMHGLESLHVKDGGFVDVDVDDIKPLLDIHVDGDDSVDVDHTRFVLLLIIIMY